MEEVSYSYKENIPYTIRIGKESPLEPYNQSTFLTLKAAYLYYLREMPQNEIAHSLNVSVPTVSRLIKRAREEKIVEFVIRDPYVECVHLEEQLETTFGLKDAIIVPAPDPEHGATTPDAAKRLVALEAARYLQRIITSRDVLGVAWGGAVRRMIGYLNPAQKIAAAFVTLHGSVAGPGEDLDVRTLVDRMSRAFSGRNYPLLTPGLAESRRAAETARKETSVRTVFDMFPNVNISIAGVGALYPEIDSILAGPEFLIASELQSLREQDAVGDVVLRFFNHRGEECDSSLAERVVGIGLDQYKGIDTKIVVAAGVGKTHALLSAMQNGLVDVLVTDSQLGKAVLDLQTVAV